MKLLNIIDYSPVDLGFTIIGTFLILIFVGYLILRKKPKKKGRNRNPDVLFYRKDVLGQPVPVFEDKSEGYKPIGGIGLRVSLFVSMAFLASFFVAKSYEKVEPIGGTYSYHNGWYDGGPFFEQAKVKKRAYKYYLDPMFPADYIIKYKQSNYSSLIFENPIQYVKTPYFNQKSNIITQNTQN
ncbi:MAG: hypothetical protein HC831_01520 [Chloroflexia bacterium]|nr:hypothetical protein [Chloroflexia bacterium]